MTFAEATFAAEADFDETRFEQDATFDDAAFEGPAVFRGVEFSGGANVLEDDCTFERVAFEREADFRHAEFRDGDFEDARFEDHATFQKARFAEDVTFAGCRFEGQADFDEAVFDGDADVSEVAFEAPAEFRGAEFTGASNHLQDNVTFRETTFASTADFDEASFTSADFRDVEFDGEADFRECSFADEANFRARSADDATRVDLTEATLSEGRIEQPADGWMRYDLTEATLGDVTLTRERADPDAAADGGVRATGGAIDRGADHQLLDYFRFCRTHFEDFEFSNHLGALEHNGWVLHEFDDGGCDFDYQLPMTAENVEVTYLNAKNAASSHGNQKAAGEFRVKRQRYARRKDLELARRPDSGLSRWDRAVKYTHAGENFFLGATCGHGHRLARVITMFVLAPLPFGFLFTLGGPAFRTEAGQVSSLGALATPEGLETLYRNVYFAYTSYTTVGYGDFSPVGVGARFLAIFEAFVVVVLSGLVLYSLIKRSEQ